MRILCGVVMALALLASLTLLGNHVLTPSGSVSRAGAATPIARPSSESPFSVQFYLPLVTTSAHHTSSVRRVNAPYFGGDVRFSETAISWFGRVTPTENYADVRVGYNDDELYVRVAAFDRRLCYNPNPSRADLTAWDALTLYLDLGGNTGGMPDTDAYRLVGQFNWWEPRDNYQAAYRGDGSDWVAATVPFTSTAGWRGSAPNNNADDRGWAITFHIPFTSLGLSAPPAQGVVWGFAATLHDRDDADDVPIADQTWPEAMAPNHPATWGQLAFGMPTYTPPPVAPSGTVTIRHKLDGVVVVDGAVGGGSNCGEGLDFWSEWGQANYAGWSDFNIQNQADVADWPCFSKYYVTFPLDSLPVNEVVLSATLTLHQWGCAGAPGQAGPSLIQALTVAEDWSESELTWNSAPSAAENVAATWVGCPPSSGWPGTPFAWDVSGAVVEAYASGEPLRLALYDADSGYDSGKYFISSDTGDWNAEGRPTLVVVWGKGR